MNTRNSWACCCSIFCGLYCSVLSSEGPWLVYCCSSVSKLECWKSKFILYTLLIVSKFNLTIRFELRSEYTKIFLGGHLRYPRQHFKIFGFGNPTILEKSHRAYTQISNLKVEGHFFESHNLHTGRLSPSSSYISFGIPYLWVFLS